LLNRLIYYTTLSLILFSCKNNPEPQSSINPEEYDRLVRVYASLLKSQEAIEKNDQNKETYLDSARIILKRYNFSRSQYDKIIQQYQQKPEQWEAFYKEVLKELEQLSSADSG
jgi:hypothetical protein